MANKMPGIEPPVCTTECIAKRKAIPRKGFIPKTKGMRRASPKLPPKPGTTPKKLPIKVATNISPKTCHCIACCSPLSIASIMYCYPFIFIELALRTPALYPKKYYR